MLFLIVSVVNLDGSFIILRKMPTSLLQRFRKFILTVRCHVTPRASPYGPLPSLALICLFWMMRHPGYASRIAFFTAEGVCAMRAFDRMDAYSRKS